MAVLKSCFVQQCASCSSQTMVGVFMRIPCPLSYDFHLISNSVDTQWGFHEPGRSINRRNRLWSLPLHSSSGFNTFFKDRNADTGHRFEPGISYIWPLNSSSSFIFFSGKVHLDLFSDRQKIYTETCQCHRQTNSRSQLNWSHFEWQTCPSSLPHITLISWCLLSPLSLLIRLKQLPKAVQNYLPLFTSCVC